MPGQLRIVVAHVVRNVFAQPVRAGERLVGATQFHFRHDQAGVVTRKFIDFPKMGAEMQVMASFSSSGFSHKVSRISSASASGMGYSYSLRWMPSVPLLMLRNP
jgi:hypothetical protein